MNTINRSIIASQVNAAFVLHVGTDRVSDLISRFAENSVPFEYGLFPEQDQRVVASVFYSTVSELISLMKYEDKPLQDQPKNGSLEANDTGRGDEAEEERALARVETYQRLAALERHSKSLHERARAVLEEAGHKTGDGGRVRYNRQASAWVMPQMRTQEALKDAIARATPNTPWMFKAQATLDDAKAALAACTLKAPAGGTVLAVNGKVGSSTSGTTSTATAEGSGTATESTSSTDFIVIADLDDLAVSVAFAEADVTEIAVGQDATLTFPGLDDATGAGTVTSISPTATSSSGVVTYATEVSITEHPDDLRLGQSASVTITTGEASDVTVVPSVAVTTSGDRSTVTVVGDDGTQTVTAIEVGVVGEDYTEVTSGVETGQQIVLTSATATDDDSDQFQFPGGGGGFGGGFGGGAGTPPNMGGGAR